MIVAALSAIDCSHSLCLGNIRFGQLGVTMKLFCNVCAILVIALSSAGCSMMAPQYRSSLENVNQLKKMGSVSVKVGKFSDGNDVQKTVSIRGSSMSSPYQDSYSQYVAEALKEELERARVWAPDASIEISGILLKNDISTMDTGLVTIEARFEVRKNGQITYNATKLVEHKYPTHFVGAVAIPRAQSEYTFAVQKLLSALFSDAAFVAAVGKPL